MKRKALLKRAGPYRVESFSQAGDQGVHLRVYPTFPDYGKDWQETRKNRQGGGPSIFVCMALAEQLEEFLNAPYQEAQRG